MSTTITREKLRNIAVIAHVDHGKTTLVDKVMEQCGESKSMERFMDNLDLEKERGITIMAKCTSLFWNDTKINVVDTPGHADFGGEVERVMSMIDGVLLLVDAAEGPMAQTKFVLAKALKRGIRPIVVINKVDKDTSRVNEVESEVFDLFAFLDATEEQLNFPVIYASGRNGWADLRVDGPRKDMTALLDTIVAHVPHPQGNAEMPFSMSTVMLGSDTFLGRLLTGCVATGSVKINDPVIALNRAGILTHADEC
jgi:GTP-binding protein